MKNSPKTLFLIQAILTAVIFVLGPKDPSHHALNQAQMFIIWGAIISALQLGLLYFVWGRVFSKKKIAPAVIAVVFKYALLGLFFWSLHPLSSSEIKALLVGVMTMPITIVLFAVTKKSRRPEKHERSE